MKPWKIQDFIQPKDIGYVNPIREWIDGQPIKAGVKIDTRIQYLEVTKVWDSSFCKKLRGYDEIYELRIVFNNIQYRPLGCMGPGAGEFTILIGAIEKGRFVPPDAPRTAEERRKLVFEDRRYVHEHEYCKGPITDKSEREQGIS